MEFQHTIEILTKDIQDIEKLVRNLQNSPKPVSIELDLALSKLRNVYEILLLIKEDKISDVIGSTQPLENETAEIKATEIKEKQEVAEEKKEMVEKKQDAVEEKPEEVIEQKPEPVNEEEPQRIVKETEETAEKAEKDNLKPKKEAEILAERFDTESSINENLGSKRSDDVTSKLASQPIDSISRNIGINDRFYIIKELFNGDSDSYNKIIESLDRSGNFNEAFSLLESRFPDTIEHEGVQILVNLSRRRFISGGNV